jgi:peptidyl-prolyl cis-trans isomerase D
MASQTPKAPLKSEPRDSKKGIKNPGIYAGTIVVLVIVVIAFIFVPMGGGSAAAISGNGRSLDFGNYDNKPIVYSPGAQGAQASYMAIQVRDLQDRLRQQGLTEDNQFFLYQVFRGAFERTVVRVAAIDSVTRAGGAVTEAWLDTKVAESPAFQENDKFSAQKYHDATLSEKLSVRDQIRDDTLYQSFFTDLLSTAPSSKETAFVKDMAKETRTIEYAAFPLSKYPDAEVETWGKAHADLFRGLALSRVTIATSEADAKKLLKNIQDKKTTFEDVAKASSKDAFAPKGGVEGEKYYYELAAELAVKTDADKLAALKVGELSPVLKTTAGAWVFFKCDAAIAPADLSQGVVLAAVRSYLTGTERSVIEDWAIAQAKALSSSGAGFEASAKKAGVAVKTTGPFPLNYGDLAISLYGQSAPLFKSVAAANDPDLAGASTNEKFLTAAFSLAPGAVSEPFVLGDNVVVLKVKEAGVAKADETAPIDFYYPYFFNSGASGEVRDLFMKSPLLKDDFSKVFFKYFQPATAAKKS